MSIAGNPPDPLAPWAEIVPDALPHMTVDDLLGWPDDDGYRYELVEGVLVRVVGSGYAAAASTANISSALVAFVHPRRLGVITSAKDIFTFPNEATGLVPNVGYYVDARRPLIVDRTRPIPFAPNLAVEVVPASQSRDDMAAKARRYLTGGTGLVWIVWPAWEQIDVWRLSRSIGVATTLTVGDILDGEDIVPGFAHFVAAVFANPLA